MTTETAPVAAWVVFSENGNVRLWGPDRAAPQAFADARGLVCEPVYRAVLGTGIPPSLPTGWTQKDAALAAWMVNTLMSTPPDEWRTKTQIRLEFVAAFGHLCALASDKGGDAT